MSGNPSKNVMRQPLPQGGDQSSVQDLSNQSFDPTFRTFLFQLAGSPDGVNMYTAKVGADGLFQMGSGLVPFSYDYISHSATSTTDIYTYKSGGSTGTTEAIVTVTYTDSTKGTLLSVART